MSGSRPQPRDDLRALDGYHSPQVEVDVRLNTNESPYSPPPEFIVRWLDALREVEWNRYPDRAATDQEDRTPAEVAAQAGHAELAALLRGA